MWTDMKSSLHGSNMCGQTNLWVREEKTYAWSWDREGGDREEARSQARAHWRTGSGRASGQQIDFLLAPAPASISWTTSRTCGLLYRRHSRRLPLHAGVQLNTRPPAGTKGWLIHAKYVKFSLIMKIIKEPFTTRNYLVCDGFRKHHKRWTICDNLQIFVKKFQIAHLDPNSAWFLWQTSLIVIDWKWNCH